VKFRDDVVTLKPSAELRRQMREGPFPLKVASGSTPQQAQLSEAAGLRLFSISGSATSAELLGLPDAGLLSLTEIVDNARRVCAAVSIPVIVDVDTGFGNPVGVKRTVSEVIKAGVAGFFIEDQVTPKRCGFTSGTEVIPVEDMVAKLRSARDMRDSLDPDVVMIARTDARNALGGGLEEVLRRCAAYLEAGADVLMVTALRDRDEIQIVRDAFPDAHLNAVVHGIRPRLTTEEYAKYRLFNQSVKVNVVGSIAMYDFLRDYAERGADAYVDYLDAHAGNPLVDFGFLDLTGFPKVIEIEKKYLPAERLKKYEGSDAFYDAGAKAAE
jgi:2-methylisocitrate lyase-like PEP mutase family enzyme